jgi:hypothetical protein
VGKIVCSINGPGKTRFHIQKNNCTLFLHQTQKLKSKLMEDHNVEPEP